MADLLRAVSNAQQDINIYLYLAMPKILFVTGNFPYDLRILVHGVYKRMRMFIDAIKEVASIEMLIFVRPEVDISPSLVSSLERSFSEYWDAEIKVFLCPITRLQKEDTFLKQMIQTSVFTHYLINYCI